MQDEHKAFSYFFKKEYLFGLVAIDIAIVESQFHKGSYKHMIDVKALWFSMGIVIKSESVGAYIVNGNELENWK